MRRCVGAQHGARIQLAGRPRGARAAAGARSHPLAQTSEPCFGPRFPSSTAQLPEPACRQRVLLGVGVCNRAACPAVTAIDIPWESRKEPYRVLAALMCVLRSPRSARHLSTCSRLTTVSCWAQDMVRAEFQKRLQGALPHDTGSGRVDHAERAGSGG